MSETNLWKIVERIEQMVDHIDDINNYLDQVHRTNQAFSIWITEATENIMELKKDINYLKNKKTCV